MTSVTSTPTQPLSPAEGRRHLICIKMLPQGQAFAAPNACCCIAAGQVQPAVAGRRHSCCQLQAMYTRRMQIARALLLTKKEPSHLWLNSLNSHVLPRHAKLSKRVLLLLSVFDTLLHAAAAACFDTLPEDIYSTAAQRRKLDSGVLTPASCWRPGRRRGGSWP